MFAIEELARQPGREVTIQLLKITEQEGLPPAVYQKAGEALIARKDGSASDLLAQALSAAREGGARVLRARARPRPADRGGGTPPPAVEILARAAGAMKATTA